MTTTVKVICHNNPAEVVAVSHIIGSGGKPTGETREDVVASLTAGQEHQDHVTQTRTIIVREPAA